MFTIGDFARLGRVSVRMLRHYDALGLLRPAQVDQINGYRGYEAAQLPRLNRIIALKDLGFTLQQVQSILDEKLDVAQLHGMLRLRRAELEAGVAADLDRLARVEARLSMIESEGLMPVNDVIVKRVPTARVATLSAFAASWEPDAIGPVIQPLFAELCRLLEEVGLTQTGPGIAYYEVASDGVQVYAAKPVSTELSPASDIAGLAVVDLPEVEAATVVYHGSMYKADAVWQELATWTEANAYTGVGYPREVTLEFVPGDDDRMVTEFQQPVVRI